MSETPTGLRTVPSSIPGRIKRIQDCLYVGYSEMQEWARKGLKSRRYVAGNQWADMLTAQQARRIRLTHNVIRDDLDKKIARLEEADLIMETHGRGGEDWQLARTWKDLLDWWREWHGEYHDSAGEVHRKVFTDQHVVGDGFTWPIWDPDEEDGLGMVVLEYGCPFHTCWDPGSKSVQLRDAFWVARFEPYDIDLLEQEFPRLKGVIKADVPRFFLEHFQGQAQGAGYPMGTDSSNWSERMNRAYRMEFWEKREKRANRYLLDGRLARVRNTEDQVIEMTDVLYDALPKREQKQYEVVSIKDYELWQSVVVGDHMAVEKLSQYDATNKGHGRFPVARYCASWDPDQTHSRGEVEPLMGYQDMINQSMSYFLESMFIGNSQILTWARGSMPQSEERKLQYYGQQAVQMLRRYPGTDPPMFVSSAGQAPQLFQSMTEYLTGLKDKYGSSVTNVHRAAPEYDMSGKAIQELMAEADLSSVKLRKGVESGLSQETFLVISLLQQNMRANRMIRIAPKASDDTYDLYLGTDEDQIVKSRGLEKVSGEEDVYQARGRTQQKARVLRISDRDVLKFDVRLSLDTGKARTKAENMRIGSSFLQYLGPAAGVGILKWLASIWDVPNQDELFQALEESDQAKKIMQQLDQIQKDTGMGLGDLVQAAQALQAMQEGAPQAPGQAPGPIPGQAPGPGAPPTNGRPPAAMA